MSQPPDLERVMQEIALELARMPREGKVADYIPELAKVPDDRLAMHLVGLDGAAHGFGHQSERFSLQSITKVFTLAMAISVYGRQMWSRVGVEPSGNAFNSLVQLEHEAGIPRNPLINAGALVVCDMIVSLYDEPKRALLQFVRELADQPTLDFNPRVAGSERQHGFRNAALAYFMKSYGNIQNPVEQVLDFYFCQCSLEMSCRELAKSFLLLANQGVVPHSGQRVLAAEDSRRVNAIMQTCGFYDESGEFSFRVGLPGKSGVGGGIVAVLPKHYAVALWSPVLNPKGNSHLGMKGLELLTTKTQHSVF